MNGYKRVVILVTGLFLSVFMQQSIAVKLNKCVDENGKITFTQMGCSYDESKMRISVEASPNSMDRMSNKARSALHTSNQKYQTKKIRTISKKPVRRRCKKR